MDKYEKCAESLMKLGDSIIAEKRRKASIIKRTAFSVSGLCAAIIVGVGIWHNSSIKTPPEMDHFSENYIITSTEVSSAITTPAIVTESSAVKAVNVTTSKTKVMVTSETMTANVTTQAQSVSAVSESTETKQSANSNKTKTDITELTENINTSINTEAISTNVPETTFTSAASNTQAHPNTNVTTTTTPFKAYRFISSGNKYRTLYHTAVIEELLSDEPIDNVQLLDYVGVGKELPIDKMALYSIKGYSHDILTVLKSPEDEGYYVSLNMNYKPESLGELMEDIDLEGKWKIINSEYVGLDSSDKECSFTDEELIKFISDLKLCKRDDLGNNWNVFLKISFENQELDGYVTDMFITKDGYVIFYDIVFFAGTDIISPFLNLKEGQL